MNEPKKEYDNTNTFVLFRSKNRKTNKHPFYTGQLNIDGIKYWVAGWVQHSPKVEHPFISLAFTEQGDINDGMADQERWKGVLFKNSRKLKPDDSDYNGNCEVGGCEYWLNSWILNKRDTNERYMRGTIQPKISAFLARAPQSPSEDLPDDIPF